MENCGILFLSREDYTGFQACIDHLGNRLDAPTSGRFFYVIELFQFTVLKLGRSNQTF